MQNFYFYTFYFFIFIFLFFYIFLGLGPAQPTWAGLDPAGPARPLARLGKRRRSTRELLTHAGNSASVIKKER
jgi:hypothetical protein